MKWIKCSELKPPQDVPIIVYGNHSCKVWCTEIYHEHIDGKPTGKVLDWSTYRDIEIYYWMPLPEPPIDANDCLENMQREFGEDLIRIIKKNYGHEEEDKPQICKICGYPMNPRGQMIVSCQCG